MVSFVGVVELEMAFVCGGCGGGRCVGVDVDGWSGNGSVCGGVGGGVCGGGLALIVVAVGGAVVEEVVAVVPVGGGVLC